MAKGFDRKIVMVGGGSYGWSPRLLSDMMQTDAMDNSEVWLLDPNPKAAREIAAVGATFAKTLGRRYKIVPTANEAAAFRDADFVLITISTGGLDMTAHDLAIPEKYGIFQTVGDTVGPGGWCRGLRNVPVFAHLATQIEKHSPRAVVLNYSNPLALLTATIHAVSNLRTVGLCHGVFGTYEVLQRLLGVEERDIAARFGGLNHFFWITDFTVNGAPGFPLLEAKLAGRTLHEALRDQSPDPHGFTSGILLASEFYRQYGCLTYMADRHIAEFMPGYLTGKESNLKRFGLVRTAVESRRKRRDQARARALDMAAGKVPPFGKSRETAVDIMAAFTTGKPFCDVTNLPNTGQVENLPLGVVVETLGLVDALGFAPVCAGALPPVIQGLVAPHCQTQEMTLEAALHGDRELAMESLMLDPLCGHLPPSQIRQMGEELMAATKAWLPQF